MTTTQLRIGMIGVTGRGGLWRHWHQPGGRSVVVAGADVNPTHLETFKAAHGGDPFVTEDYRELLECPDVDAVAITSPDFCHETHAVAALEAGKHVFCEKPLAITIEGCDRILEAWRRSGTRLMVGFNMRYMAMFRVMKEIVDAGTIGEIKAVWVRHFVGFGSDFYFHDWHATRQNANSLLLQKGSHDIDVIHWITGRYTTRTAAFGGLDFFGGGKPNDLTCPTCAERETCTEALNGRRVQCVFRQEVDVEDNHVMIMELEGGIKASYLQCHFTPDYHRNYTFIGTEGRLENSEPEMKVWVKTRRSNYWRDLADRTYDIKPTTGGHGGADPVICKDFVDMCLDGKEPLASPLAGRMSVAAGVCAAHSLRHGGIPVDVPPAPVGFS
ncbi:MAG: Gfo/Idh/MocA family oxidoreductase [Anaerolineae bacterium]|nr:Gfo/Idh/MocA family oxidoreductase [Anaerolineae bacterium]